MIPTATPSAAAYSTTPVRVEMYANAASDAAKAIIPTRSSRPIGQRPSASQPATRLLGRPLKTSTPITRMNVSLSKPRSARIDSLKSVTADQTRLNNPADRVNAQNAGERSAVPSGTSSAARRAGVVTAVGSTSRPTDAGVLRVKSQPTGAMPSKSAQPTPAHAGRQPAAFTHSPRPTVVAMKPNARSTV